MDGVKGALSAMKPRGGTRPTMRRHQYLGLWRPPTAAQNTIARRWRAVRERQIQLDAELLLLRSS